jgi:hypothetical protein
MTIPPLPEQQDEMNALRDLHATLVALANKVPDGGLLPDLRGVTTEIIEVLRRRIRKDRDHVAELEAMLVDLENTQARFE